jgi:hypothetical protein
VESFLEICVIRERKVVFQSSHKDGPIPLLESARDKERRGVKTCVMQVGRCLSRFFLQIVDKLLKSFTFVDQFTLSLAYFNMDLWTSLSFVTNKITHL